MIAHKVEAKQEPVLQASSANGGAPVDEPAEAPTTPDSAMGSDGVASLGDESLPSAWDGPAL
eukprot:15478381-Alexandrium_andersonii.AAC.1